MRIVSEAKYNEEVERRMTIRDEHRWNCERFEHLEKKLYELEKKVDKLTELAHEPLVAYQFSKDGYRKTLKDFLKSEAEEK